MSISYLKLIVRKLLGRSVAEKFATLKGSGNLVVGDNCDINALQIHAYATDKGFVNVQIGEGSFLLGKIILHKSTSKVVIGERVFIGPETTIFCYDEVRIDNDVMISWGCTLIDTNAHSLKSDERATDVTDWKKGWQYKNWSVVDSKLIHVKQKCWIGFNSIIMKGVTLEEGTVVAAGSVVTKSTTAFDIVGGNPATFIKKTE